MGTNWIRFRFNKIYSQIEKCIAFYKDIDVTVWHDQKLEMFTQVFCYYSIFFFVIIDIYGFVKSRTKKVESFH